MDQPVVIAGLVRKRAELAGALLASDKLTNKLREDLANLDATLKLFAPDVRPTAIRPAGKRPPPRFKTGQLTKVVLTILREADHALSIREIMEKVATDHQIDISTKRAATKLDYSIRSALARQRPGIARSVPGSEVMTWRAE